MDESWRMRMGIHNLPRRNSTEETLPNRTRQTFPGESGSNDPNDFNDVFGGPPRTVLSRKFSGGFTQTTSFYEEIFWKPEPTLTPSRSGRNLPVFRIPANRESSSGFQRTEGFYSDIFGSDDDVRFPWKWSLNSKLKSRSTSSSALSSEDLSPLRPVTGDDAGLFTFASELRPINVPHRWNSTMLMPAERPKEEVGMPAFPPCYVKNKLMENDYNESLNSSYFGFSRQVPSPESINLEPNLFGSMKVSGDDIEINSAEYDEAKGKTREMEEEEEVMSCSYVIEINSDYRGGNCEAISIDEAVAWAKERYQKQCKGIEEGDVP